MGLEWLPKLDWVTSEESSLPMCIGTFLPSKSPFHHCLSFAYDALFPPIDLSTPLTTTLDTELSLGSSPSECAPRLFTLSSSLAPTPGRSRSRRTRTLSPRSRSASTPCRNSAISVTALRNSCTPFRWSSDLWFLFTCGFGEKGEPFIGSCLCRIFWGFSWVYYGRPYL